MAEGSIWEAFEHAACDGLDNLTAIVDVNRLGQTRETMLGWDLDGYAGAREAFGWHAIEIDGHDVDAIDAAYARPTETTGRPTVILARTQKGKGVKAVEDQPGKHGKPLDDPEEAIEELGGERDLTVQVAKPEAAGEPHRFETAGGELPRWELGEEVATRKAYGEALAALGSIRGDVVALDGEVSNSTHSELFAKAHPDRYFEMFIAEQQMIAAAVGMQVRGWVPFASTFAAFLSRAYDFVRMAAISRANLRLSGSHAGVSIGEDGPSQMALEDIAALRAIHGSAVLHPSDANQTAQARRARWPTARASPTCARCAGKTAVRTPRGRGRPDRRQPRAARTDGDDVTIVACGITVDEAERGGRGARAATGISVRVIDCYSIKPIDAETLARGSRARRGAIVTVEDHWPEGGLGDAVLERARGGRRARPPVVKLAVREMPGSGTPERAAARGGDRRRGDRRRGPEAGGRRQPRIVRARSGVART